MTSIFQAGTAKVDITPPLTIPYLGYEPRHDFFRGVHDPLYARALAVDDGEAQTVLIAADSIGYSNHILGPGRNFTAEVRQCIQEQTGVPAENVMLASSHAHSTPETVNLRTLLDTPAAGPWLEVLMDQLASAAAMAVEHRKPSTLKMATGEVHGLSWSRRIVGKDYLGYFATPAAWEQGGYEVGYGPWARVGPGGGSLLVERALEMIRKLWDEQEAHQ